MEIRSSVYIRNVTLNDVGVVSELVVSYRAEMGFPSAGPDAVSAFLDREMRERRLLASIALVSGEAQGFLITERSFSVYSLSSAIYYADLWVAAAHRRQGLAKALIEYERDRQPRQTYSFCLVGEDNLAARALVKSLGLAPTDIAFYRSPVRLEGSP